MQSPPRVFISYAHESEAHRVVVLALADQLRADGIDARIDRYIEDDPPYWPMWMIEEIAAADFVICVISPRYVERVSGLGQMNEGLGARWEGAIITETAYQSLAASHKRFIAVVFDARLVDIIPPILFPRGRTSYLLQKDYGKLYRRITGQPSTPSPPLGPIVCLPPGARPNPDAAFAGYEQPRVRFVSRPPFDVAEFRDRVLETRQLAEACTRPGRELILVTGRTGAGKTALVSLVFRLLETESRRALTLYYLSAAGAVPLTEDLLRATIKPQDQARHVTLESDFEPGTVLAIDHAERLFTSGATRWRSPALRDALSRLLETAIEKLIVMSRVHPGLTAFRDMPTLDVNVSTGLPSEDARDILLNWDHDGRLGLKSNPHTVDHLVEVARGNPRVLELVVAALANDALLTPSALLSAIGDPKSMVFGLLRESYRDLSKVQRAVLSTLAMADGALPLVLLQNVLSTEREEPVAEAVRSLARRYLLKVDRAGGHVSIDPLDAKYVQRAFVTASLRPAMHRQIAKSLREAVDGQMGRENRDVWALTSVRHLIDAGDYEEALRTVNEYESAFLESHGLYDQLILLRERLLHRIAPSSQRHNYRSLIRLHSLAGNAERMLTLLEEADRLISADDGTVDPDFEIEVGCILGDVDQYKESFRRFHRARSVGLTPMQMSRRDVGAAQIVRRLGFLGLSGRLLERAQNVLSESRATFEVLRLSALTAHHRAMNSRFMGDRAAARRFLSTAYQFSEHGEDRGGLAYRKCLEAALLTDEFALDDARALQLEALRIYAEINDRWGFASAALALASTLADLGEYEAAQKRLSDAETNAARSHNSRVIALARSLSLTISRRSKKRVGLSSSGDAEEMLSRSGLKFYARRARWERDLHIFLLGKASATRPPTLRGMSHDVLGEWTPRPMGQSTLLAIRPLSAAVNIGRDQLPPGVRYDFDLAASLGA